MSTFHFLVSNFARPSSILAIQSHFEKGKIWAFPVVQFNLNCSGPQRMAHRASVLQVLFVSAFLSFRCSATFLLSKPKSVHVAGHKPPVIAVCNCSIYFSSRSFLATSNFWIQNHSNHFDGEMMLFSRFFYWFSSDFLMILVLCVQCQSFQFLNRLIESVHSVQWRQWTAVE